MIMIIFVNNKRLYTYIRFCKVGILEKKYLTKTTYSNTYFKCFLKVSEFKNPIIIFKYFFYSSLLGGFTDWLTPVNFIFLHFFIFQHSQIPFYYYLFIFWLH